MIGHLLPERFEEAINAFESTDSAVGAMTEAAKRHGWSTIVTADHGNIEEDGPAHSANDVLTTVIPPIGNVRPLTPSYVPGPIVRRTVDYRPPTRLRLRNEGRVRRTGRRPVPQREHRLVTRSLRGCLKAIPFTRSFFRSP